MQLKSKLQSTQAKPIRDHILKILQKMLQNPDPNFLTKFEAESFDIRKNTKKAISEPFKLDEQIQNGLKNITGAGPCGYIPNIFQILKNFSQAGIGLSQQDTYLVFKSLVKLSVTKSLKNVKLWGKIICREKDYYIAQGIVQGGQQQDLAPDVQPKGTGVNKFNYWACNSLIGQWIQLPIITPQQLISSRKICYLFSGNLQKDIITNPFFNGKQKHLLKCQIVRITASTTICPRTMYNLNPQGQVEPTQQWKWPNFSFLSQLQNWVHQIQNILKNGRTSHIKPQIADGQDQVLVLKAIQDKDPFQKKLKPLSQDQYYSKKAWTVKIKGNCNEVGAIAKDPAKINNGLIIFCSQVWKGLYIVYQNRTWNSLYVGYGLKTEKSMYFPRTPQLVQYQQKDCQQHIEPNYAPQQPKQQERKEQVNENQQENNQ